MMAISRWRAMTLAAFAATVLSGCGVLSDNVITDLHGNTTTKHGAMVAAQVEVRKPEYRKVFELTGWEGQDIVLSGVRSLTIYAEPDEGGIQPYVSPGYQLTRDLATTVLFPLMSWGIIREIMPWTRPLVVEQPPVTVIEQPPPIIVRP